MNTTIKYIRKGLEVFLDCDSSKMLNDLGFNRKCKYAYYEPFTGIIRKTDIKWCGYVYDAPTIDVTERWLRENKNIHFDIHFDINKIAYKIIIIENIIDENTELFLPGMKSSIHFNPNNTFFRGETHVYENLDDAKADAIHLALKYLTLPKNEYHEYYGKYIKNDKE